MLGCPGCMNRRLVRTALVLCLLVGVSYTNFKMLRSDTEY